MAVSRLLRRGHKPGALNRVYREAGGPGGRGARAFLAVDAGHGDGERDGEEA